MNNNLVLVFESSGRRSLDIEFNVKMEAFLDTIKTQDIAKKHFVPRDCDSYAGKFLAELTSFNGSAQNIFIIGSVYSDVLTANLMMIADKGYKPKLITELISLNDQIPTDSLVAQWISLFGKNCCKTLNETMGELTNIQDIYETDGYYNTSVL